MVSLMKIQLWMPMTSVTIMKTTVFRTKRIDSIPKMVGFIAETRITTPVVNTLVSLAELIAGATETGLFTSQCGCGINP